MGGLTKLTTAAALVMALLAGWNLVGLVMARKTEEWKRCLDNGGVIVEDVAGDRVCVKVLT